MQKVRTAGLSAIILALIIASAATHPRAADFGAESSKFIRVELVFGFDRKGDEPVTAGEWDSFLADEVTPRFPDGFTVIEARGQYRGGDGAIVREESRIIVFLYPKASKRKNGALIDEIRAAYKLKFKQESVLRIDFVKPLEIGF